MLLERSELIRQERELTFDDVRGADGGVGVEAQSLGMTEEQRQCRFGTRSDIVVQRLDHLVQLRHRVVHVQYDTTDLVEFGSHLDQVVAPQATDDSRQARHRRDAIGRPEPPPNIAGVGASARRRVSVSARQCVGTSAQRTAGRTGEPVPSALVTTPVRQFGVDDTSYEIEGASADDVYLGSIGDGFEHRLDRFVTGHLPPDGVAIDIGANIGAVAVLLAHRLPDGHVHACEPGPASFRLLARNLERNGIANATPWPVAIGDRCGQVDFHEHSAFGHVVSPGADVPSTPVPMRTVDDLVDEIEAASGLDRIDLLKIDVEGHEPEVMAGAVRTIERFAPRIWIELNTWSLISTGHDPIASVAAIIEPFEHVYRVGGTEDDPRLFRPLGPGDPTARARSLVHDNVVHRRSWEDLVLSAHDDIDVSLTDPLPVDPRETEIARLRHELELVTGSKAWRLTAPARRVRGWLARPT